MSEAPRGLFGGSYRRFFDSGSRYSPERKKVMCAPCSLARSRKRGNSPLPTSPAPSQEKTTNCGGVWPGSSGTGLSGWWGCLPVKEVEPSPIGRTVLLGLGYGVPERPPREPPARSGPSDPLRPPQPASETAAAAPAPSPSIPLRVRLRMASPIVTREDRKSTRLNSSHVKSSYAVLCLKKQKAWSRRRRVGH